MKPNTEQLEILLFTNSSTSKRRLAEQKSKSFDKMLSPVEELQKQCWAGLLSELLPDIIASFRSNQNSYIWSITAENYCIRINIGLYPQRIAGHTVLNPRVFLEKFLLN
ncbi:MAG TPA: hypothetical protein VHD35_06170 [Chitinophagaceae bacterium]|nr:hypothetical protein [Chitinophagaceae bacterium]